MNGDSNTRVFWRWQVPRRLFAEQAFNLFILGRGLLKCDDCFMSAGSLIDAWNSRDYCYSGLTAGWTFERNRYTSWRTPQSAEREKGRGKGKRKKKDKHRREEKKEKEKKWEERNELVVCEFHTTSLPFMSVKPANVHRDQSSLHANFSYNILFARRNWIAIWFYGQ